MAAACSVQLERRLATVTEAERQVLRQYLVSSEVKLIARALAISPGAVEKRLERARRKLGVTRSLDAALAVAREEGKTTDVAYFPPVGPADDEKSEVPSEWGGGQPTLYPTRDRPWNTLPSWARLAVMAGLVLVIAVAILVMASVQSVLSQAFGR